MSTIFKFLQNSPPAAVANNVLEDFPGCGIHNNDTFSFTQFNQIYNLSFFGSEANGNWSVECLWDCT
jgi:hypothetical protein